MKDKFIKVISPITVAIMLVLDICVIVFGVYSVKRLCIDVSFWTISFLVIEIIAFFIALFSSKEAVSNGIAFRENEMEFTAIDDNNIFEYDSIEKIETIKDTSVSFKKNFVDRYSKIILYMKNESVVTIDLGLTTKKTLKKIEAEINDRI
jgi:hypothetical protein